MVEASIGPLLAEAAQEALETMFFAMPDTVSIDPRRPDGEVIAASLAFQGWPHGRFGLVVSTAAARTLAANFIGCDESDDIRPDQMTGVIGELANMICGGVLSKLESDASFDLGAPSAVLVGAEEPGADFTAGMPAICRLEVPEGTLVAYLAFEKAA